MILQRLSVLSIIQTNPHNNQTRSGWFCFFKLNPRISLKKPECTRSNRFISFNNFAVKKYFDNVDLLIEKFKVAESTVFTVGETEMSTPEIS